MKVRLEIARYDPSRPDPSWRDTFEVEVEGTDRVLDALLIVARNQDKSLAFRRSCAHGVCGSDAMRINDKERLACKTLIQDVIEKSGDTITIEPLRHLPVTRDLVVDQEPFFKKYRSVTPYLQPSQPAPPKGEYIQSPEDRALYDEATKCINCSACYSACPVLKKNPNFLGPAALVQASRFVFDSRDGGLEKRLDILDQKDGVWPCENHFECTRVCPREIKVTKLINLTKREIKRYRKKRGEETAEAANNSSDNQ